MPTKTVRHSSHKSSAARLHKQLDASLEDLTHAELIRRLISEEVEYIFKHALVQESAQSSLLHSDRKRLHLQVARSYETLAGENGIEEHAAILAQHYAAAEDHANTFTYGLHAGDVASNVYAGNEAITFYTLALDAAKHSEPSTAQLSQLYTKLGRQYELTDRYTEAMNLYMDMESIAQARADRSLELQSLVSRGTILATYTSVFDPTQAQEISEPALRLARELNDRAAEAKILWNLMLLQVFLSHQEEAAKYGERSLALARELNLPEQIAYTSLNLGGVYMGLAQPARAEALLREAETNWRELHNQPMLADNVMMLSSLAMLQGDYDRAIALAEEGMQISRDISNNAGQLSNSGTLVDQYLQRGELARAFMLQESSMALADKYLGGFYATFARAMEVYVLGQLGQFERGEQGARLVEQGLTQPIPPFFGKWSFVMLGLFYLAQGDVDAADRALQQAQIPPSTTQLSPAIFFGIVAQGRLLLARRDYASAVERMQDYIQFLVSRGYHARLAEVLYLQAKGLRGAGKIREALDTLEQARTEAEPRQLRYILWQIFAELMDIEQERGNMKDAEEFRMEARTVLEFIVEHTPPESRQSFLNLPNVRKVMSHA